MSDTKEMPLDGAHQPEETVNEAVDMEKMANLDKMIEDFKKANPAKNKKKSYPGVF